MNLSVRYIGLICIFGLALTAAGAPPPEVRPELRPPGGQVVLLKARGKGRQIYKCTANAWTLEKPDATLFDEAGRRIGKHYEGPTWEASDGSKVVGQLLQRDDAPQAGAVPWLLLKAKTNEGSGRFAKVTYIQRVNTAGGAAPKTGCDESHAGKELSVNYQADYYFYVPQSR